MIFTIAARELRSLFLSPLGWTALAGAQLILAWIFLILVDEYLNLQGRLTNLDNPPGVTDLVVTPLLRAAALIGFVITPLITMRSISGERRNRTLPLLLSAPLGMREIVLGKYLGVVGFLLVLAGMAALMPLSLLAGTDLDTGKLAAGLLGLVLMLAAFAAAGVFISTLTAQPATAGIATFGLLLLLWLINAAGASGEQASTLFAYLSLVRHYDAFLRGLFDSTDFFYYLIFIVSFLELSVRRLLNERLLG